jgi:hypothetical protein
MDVASYVFKRLFRRCGVRRFGRNGQLIRSIPLQQSEAKQTSGELAI